VRGEGRGKKEEGRGKRGKGRREIKPHRLLCIFNLPNCVAAGCV
jgi:hypothetical protein